MAQHYTQGHPPGPGSTVKFPRLAAAGATTHRSRGPPAFTCFLLLFPAFFLFFSAFTCFHLLSKGCSLGPRNAPLAARMPKGGCGGALVPASKATGDSGRRSHRVWPIHPGPPTRPSCRSTNYPPTDELTNLRTYELTGPDQAKLPLHDYLARHDYPAVKKKRGFWDASWQAWNTNLTRQAKRAEEVSRLEKRAARAAGAVGAPDETRLRPARPASTRCTHV